MEFRGFWAGAIAPEIGSGWAIEVGWMEELIQFRSVAIQGKYEPRSEAVKGFECLDLW